MGKTNLVKVKEEKGRRRGRNKSASFRGEKKGSLVVVVFVLAKKKNNIQESSPERPPRAMSEKNGFFPSFLVLCSIVYYVYVAKQMISV